MELPLDHFRLLGVSPNVGYDMVLQTLKRRLDTPPGDGYTAATIDARAELLRISAGLLSDPERRRQYEQALTSFRNAGPGQIPTVEVPEPLQVAGLLLLLEAPQPREAFEAAVDLRQGHKAASLDRDSAADLDQLIRVAAHTAAWEVWNQRFYEEAAEILEKALALLANASGSSPHPWRQRLQDDLAKLRPYRILDLLSRDLAASRERQQGLELLRELIEERGGLDAEDDPQMSPVDFQSFLKQIRTYMTVSEQLDLYEAWSRRGSASAEFLSVYAMAACGFHQRKPEHIRQALARIVAMPVKGLEPEQACLLLLLGRTDEAQERIESCHDPALSRWLSTSASDPLAGLCAFCHDWLSKQVLPGYRGMDPVVDLDAYFVDRDVQSYIEAADHQDVLADEDNEQVDSDGQDTVAEEQQEVAGPFPKLEEPEEGDHGSGRPLLFEPPSLDLPPPPPAIPHPEPAPDHDKPRAAAGTRARRKRRTPQPEVLWGLVVIAGLGGGLWLWGSRRKPSPIPATTGQPVPETAQQPEPEILLTPLQAAQAAEVLDGMAVKVLLEAWLQLKSDLLADGTRAAEISAEQLNRLVQLAAPNLAEAVRNQRRLLHQRGERLVVQATPMVITMLEPGPDRITARVVLEYAETTVDAQGTATARSGPKTLSNDYVFARTSAGWKLQGFGPSPSP